MHSPVFSSIDGREFPLVVARKWIDRLSQVCNERLKFVRCAQRSAGLPKIGAKIQILHAEAVAFVHRGIKVFWPRKIVHFGERAGKGGFVLGGKGYVCSIEIG